eukprot:1745656-Rhodomonas_salina.2
MQSVAVALQASSLRSYPAGVRPDNPSKPPPRFVPPPASGMHGTFTSSSSYAEAGPDDAVHGVSAVADIVVAPDTTAGPEDKAGRRWLPVDEGHLDRPQAFQPRGPV